LDLDPRSTGHYVKCLEEKGAITRHGVSINKMYTNICVHARFKLQKESIDMNTVGDDEDVNEVPYNVNADGKVYSQTMVRNTMIDLAKDAPNHAIISRDVLHGMVSINSISKKLTLTIYIYRVSIPQERLAENGSIAL
jgi:hypothetical protein